ncbi:IucA/IucC protein [Psychrobacter sp. TAE2020]|uniref:IucA/IucC family protein n=1 Tax=Psychrobacter sp. TAE2020 TaxID=2846762 RepID=UPI001C1063B2|nr:IucA/IucC family protein [Psychrobacter sp. TAE2020]MBU5615745.1 IucA/IucC protein [Psychrobacter sp. TAE2020]
MDKQYITERFINTCIREDVYGLLSDNAVIQTEFDIPNLPETLKQQTLWLEITSPKQTNWLPIIASDYMQYWQLASPVWLQKNSDGYIIKHDYEDFVAILKQLSGASETALDSYLLELDCATEHRALARQGFESQHSQLVRNINEYPSWSERLLYADQVASYLDHPYYPTARAKLGLDAADIAAYSPEFAPTFSLYWVAISKALSTVSAKLPNIWPSFADVGLNPDLQQTHHLFPIHPLTLPLLQQHALKDDTGQLILAPKSALSVQPTLSVRTVVCCADSNIHIKVPLIVRTLGNKNVRLIKSSTIYDGYWFQRTLQLIAEKDVALQGYYAHCDESLGGHMGDDKTLAFIVRRYDDINLTDKTPVPVAAFGSVMPDDRPFISHLIDIFYDGDSRRWLKEYIALLCHVHLILWIKYGIALEANQQNAVIVFDQHSCTMTLLMKDNDSARLYPPRFNAAMTQIGLSNVIDINAINNIKDIKDQRIVVEDELALAQMFLTITLQLDIVAIIEMMSNHDIINRNDAYQILTDGIDATLHSLSVRGYDTHLAQKVLLENQHWYIKYLLCAGSLLSKEESGATDINKFYGKSAPNTLKLMQQLNQDS